jgi:hypothetical protein
MFPEPVERIHPFSKLVGSTHLFSTPGRIVEFLLQNPVILISQLIVTTLLAGGGLCLLLPPMFQMKL